MAHDLRTPLTRMRGRLEKGSNQQFSVSQYQTLVNDTIFELDEILRMFSSILRISQIEMRNQRGGFRDIDLTQIAREVVELFDPAVRRNPSNSTCLAMKRYSWSAIGICCLTPYRTSSIMQSSTAAAQRR